MEPLCVFPTRDGLTGKDDDTQKCLTPSDTHQDPGVVMGLSHEFIDGHDDVE